MRVGEVEDYSWPNVYTRANRKWRFPKPELPWQALPMVRADPSPRKRGHRKKDVQALRERTWFCGKNNKAFITMAIFFPLFLPVI